MKLTKEQILQIRNFVSDRGIRYYDVQLEIIDHVACKVEDLMTADPNLTLDEAIAQTHAGFGETSFKIIEDTMRRSLQKKYWRLFRTIFISYLTPLYLLPEIGFIYLIYLLATKTDSADMPMDIVWIILLLPSLVSVIYAFKHQQDLGKKYKRRMLTVQMGAIVTTVVNLPVQLFIWFFLLSRPVSSLFGTSAHLHIH